jgi:hypothetical protein
LHTHQEQIVAYIKERFKLEHTVIGQDDKSVDDESTVDFFTKK